MSDEPKVVRRIRDMQAWSRGYREAGRSIGLVPTMGNLHEGHLSLVRMALAECDRVIVSLFVNPTQFGPGEDFEAYPRSWEADLEKLARLRVPFVFAPAVEEMYPPGDATRITVGWGGDRLCGAARPGHFDGVATVVAKLFGAVNPDLAVFGQKDAQQALIIRRLVRSLAFPVALRLGPTRREADGLAMSSRNAYLKPEDRARATVLYRALEAAGGALVEGERNAGVLARRGMEILAEAEPEYFEVVDPETLETPGSVGDGLLLIACAARLGGARLIDNHVYRIEGKRVEEALLF